MGIYVDLAGRGGDADPHHSRHSANRGRGGGVGSESQHRALLPQLAAGAWNLERPMERAKSVIDDYLLSNF